MAKKSWLGTFYSPPSETWSDAECANHTKLKYTGALQINLDKYKAVLYHIHVIEKGDTVLTFTGDNCSYCQKYYQSKFRNPCQLCPIYIEDSKCDENESAFDIFIESGDPKPMINLMDKILDKCDENGKYINK